MRNNQKIIGFIQAKNEYPLFMLSISHALNNGVDEVYFLDDSSDDDSIQGIKKLKEIWKERLHVVFSKDKTFSQEEKINLLIRTANPSIGDWIYVFDADEFLAVKNNQSLKVILESCKQEDIISYPVLNWYSYHDFDDSNIENFKKIQYRAIPFNFENNSDLQSDQIYNEEATFFDFQFVPKIIFRFSEDAWVLAGAHELKLPTGKSNQIKEVQNFEAIHLSYLTKKRLIKKASQGLAHIKEKRPSWHGWQNQLLYKLQSENKLDRFWLLSSLDEKKDKAEIISDHITFDSRFQNLITPVIDILQNKNYQNDISHLEFNNLTEAQFPFSFVTNLLSNANSIGRKAFDNKIGFLKDSIETLNKEIINLNDEVNQLNKVILERDGKISNLSHEISNRDNWALRLQEENDILNSKLFAQDPAILLKEEKGLKATFLNKPLNFLKNILFKR